MLAKEALSLTENRILAALSRQEYAYLFSRLQPVYLSRGKVLYDFADPFSYAYFLTNGMVSLLSITEDGSTTQVSMVGNEGIVGVASVLKVNKAPYRIIVQIPGQALRVRTDVLCSEFNRSGQLQDLMLRYLHALLTQISQSAACNRFHTIEERLCRWLLISHDRVKANMLQLTQETLSHMVGASRTNVTIAANNLKKSGLITYSRGNIEILDRVGLESASCECYRIITEEIGYLCAA
ncbi:MAG TPA: Crp/Fnr family transcriptional regulator [Pyrinomonadaceae bacterium]|jgi:CRP-like cAMP-binding protein